MTPVLAFDIETIPDIAGLRSLHSLLDADISDADVAEYAFQRQRQKNGSDFLPHHLHRVVAISCVLRWSDRVHVSTIGQPGDSEARMLETFFALIEKYTPQMVSWNGGGFDLPVLHYRALIHGVTAPRYWDMGDGHYQDSREFKWNNYIGRYHTRHLDLMDLLAMYQPRASAPLDDLANRFHLLAYGLALVLVFIGGKMLLIDFYKIPIGYALLVTATLIAGSIVLSLRASSQGSPALPPKTER